MQVEDQAAKDEDARAEFHDRKIEWEKTIHILREVQVSPKEEKAQREWFESEKEGFLYRYSGIITEDTLIKIINAIHIIRIDLDFALRKGRENYEQERHKRRIEIIRALQLGSIIIIIVCIILFVIIKLVFNIEIPLFY
jgi:hypothetical protein